MTDLRSQLQSSLGDVYAIERELGGGGMSRVFVATERALGRKVVIKVLPAELAGAVSTERFRREIELAARLQQANIVPVLSAGDAAGVPYFTIPYVSGESLRVRLASGTPVPVNESVGILREVARALAHAHEQGIVHRDIKPDNVLLSGGTAMVTDFGVAKALSAATTAGGGLTGTGVALGTPAYMAPEQASGQADIDHRADIYALGCLGYELLTGAAPFAGRTAREMIAAHITEMPEGVTIARPAVPSELGALIMRCLAKAPADRPQSTTEFASVLDTALVSGGTQRAHAPRQPLVWLVGVVAVALVAIAVWATRGSRPGPTHTIELAVLPFVNSTGDSTVAYLAEGLSDEIRGLLTGNVSLAVKPRSSSLQMAGHTARDAGTRLEVDAVLEGTLTKSAAGPTVIVELVRVRDERSLWSGRFDLKATGVAAWRDSLSRSVLIALGLDEQPGQPAAIHAARGTADDEAYDLFLRGEYYRRRFAIAEAIAPLEKAVERDPDFARAHAGLALAYATLPIMGTAMTRDAIARATRSADRALAIVPDLGTAHMARAFVIWQSEQRLPEVEEMLRRATTIDPGDSEIRVWHAFLLASLGRLDEASTVDSIALRLDPLSIDALVVRQALAYGAGRFRDAINATPAIFEFDPNNAAANWNVAGAYAFAGRPDSAVLAIERMLQVSRGMFGSDALATWIYAAAGKWDLARRQRQRALTMDTNSPNYMRAIVDMAFGEYESAINAVERGVRAREPVFNTIWLGCEPFFWKISEHPRFVAVVHGLGAKVCKPGPEWPIGPAPKR